MKKFKDMTSGEIWTMEELQRYFEYFKYEMIDKYENLMFNSFDEYLDYVLSHKWLEEI